MEDEERQRLRELLQEYQRRLHVLELQQAKQGIQTPPQVVTEIEDIRKSINRLEAQLGRHTPAEGTGTLKDDVSQPISPIGDQTARDGQSNAAKKGDSAQPANHANTLGRVVQIVVIITCIASIGIVGYILFWPKAFRSTISSKDQIVFVSNRAGNLDIWVVHADGSQLRQLTKTPASNVYPAWSRDGKQIAFVSGDAAHEDIYVMNADGSELRQLTKDPSEDTLPTWSPDGKQIAFVSNRAGQRDIWVMHADGSNPKQVTSTIKEIGYPDWSPDGKQIVFDAPDDTKDYEIYTINADGGQPVMLTNTRAEDTAPAWSPDGKQIAFVSNRAGNRDIWVMHANGSQQRQLTNTPENDYWPTWSSDGRRIMFTRDRSPKSNCPEARSGCVLYIMQADGSGQTSLTDYNATNYDAMPDWSWSR